MRSRARFKGHPLHPMLIPFPLAFLLGAVLFDSAGVITGRQAWRAVGSHLLVAGVAAALLAAIPGLIDYVYTVPPQSSGRQRALRHMIANLSAVGLFAIAWLSRGDPSDPPGALTLGVELLAGGVLLFGGWLGGTLVTRNLIGIDHRYARAGKWRETRLPDAAGARIAVADSGELEIDQMKLVRVGSDRIVLARTSEGYVAFDDRCTHRGGSLAGGVMIGGTVQCLWHGSQFDGANGRARCGPATEPIRTYSVEAANGQIWLDLSRRG